MPQQWIDLCARCVAEFKQCRRPLGRCSFGGRASCPPSRELWMSVHRATGGRPLVPLPAQRPTALARACLRSCSTWALMSVLTLCARDLFSHVQRSPCCGAAPRPRLPPTLPSGLTRTAAPLPTATGLPSGVPGSGRQRNGGTRKTRGGGGRVRTPDIRRPPPLAPLTLPGGSPLSQPGPARGEGFCCFQTFPGQLQDTYI